MYQSNPKRYDHAQYSSQSIDDTTLDDDDPVDQLNLNVDEEDYPDDMRDYNDKYLNEKNAIHDAQSVRYTAYTMRQDSGNSIVTELRNVGVTVLSLESLSTSAMIHYMDAVTSMRLGEANDEKCMLYTDRMGRVFNVVISGGAQGLAKSWSIVQASYSGWMAIVAIPFLARVITSLPLGGSNGITDTTVAMNPLMMLLLFAFVLQNETSHVWLAMSIYVRGSNSVGSHVWRDGGLTDYPRLLLLVLLILATFSTGTVQRILTWAGVIYGCLILLCNLGSRSWKKIELNPIDFNSVFSAPIVILASLFAGFAFPYMGLRAVDSGSDDSSGKDEVEKIILHPNGNRGRKNIALASSSAAVVFLLSDVKVVQEALGFDFSRLRGITNFIIGVWLFFSSLVSILLCQRLDSSRSKKIEPFLRRDETSPVGWIVPSIPNIVIDPNLSRNKIFVPGSDIFCSLIVCGLAFLISWTGVEVVRG